MVPRKLHYIRIEDNLPLGSDAFARLPIQYHPIAHWLEFCSLLQNNQVPEFELLTADFQFDEDHTTPQLWVASARPIQSAPELQWHPALRRLGVTSGILMAATLAGMSGEREIPAGAAVHTAIKSIVKVDLASTMLTAQIMLLCGDPLDTSDTFRLLEDTIALVQDEASRVFPAFVKACQRFRTAFLRRCGVGVPGGHNWLWANWDSVASSLSMFMELQKKRGKVSDEELEQQLRERFETDGLEFYDRRGDAHSLHIASMFSDLLVDILGPDWVPDDAMLLPAVMPPSSRQPEGGVIWQFFKALESVAEINMRPLRQYFDIPKEARQNGMMMSEITNATHRLLAVVFAWLEQFEEEYREHRGDSHDLAREDDDDVTRGLPSKVKDCEELLKIINDSFPNAKEEYIPLHAKDAPSILRAVREVCSIDERTYGICRALHYGEGSENYDDKRPAALRGLLLELVEWGALEEQRDRFRLIKNTLGGEYPFAINRHDLSERLGFSDLNKQLGRILAEVPGYKNVTANEFLHNLHLKPLPGHFREIALQFVHERWWDSRKHMYKVPERSWPRCIRRSDGPDHGLGITWERLYRQRAREAMDLICPESMELRRPGMTIACRKVPYDWVGGDYYAIVGASESAPCRILLGDAVGKREPAAFLTCEIHGYLKRSLKESRSLTPKQILGDLNRCILERQLEDNPNRERSVLDSKYDLRTMTMFAAEFDGRMLRWSSGGHPSPLVVSATGEVRHLHDVGDSGPALGYKADPVFPDASARLSAGEMVVFYTDGVFEDLPAFRDREAEARFQMVLREAALETPVLKEILELLFERLDQQRPQKIRQDDATVVILRVENPN